MCPNACWLQYDAHTLLRDISCPCGHGYWDILQGHFVTGATVRENQAASRTAYEARLSKEIPDIALQNAKLRAQFITYFLDHDRLGGVAEISEQQAQGEFAATEVLEEILRTDYVDLVVNAHTRHTKEAGFSDCIEIDELLSCTSPGSQSSICEVAKHGMDHTRTSRPCSENKNNVSQVTAPPRSCKWFSTAENGQSSRWLPLYDGNRPEQFEDECSDSASISFSGPGAPDSEYLVIPSSPSTTVQTIDDANRAIRDSEHYVGSQPVTFMQTLSIPKCESVASISPLLAKFTLLGESQHVNIAAFCQNNCNIFDQDFQHLHVAARQHLEIGDASKARRMVHRLVILRQASRLSHTERDEYLQNLVLSSERQQEIREKVDRVISLLEPQCQCCTTL